MQNNNIIDIIQYRQVIYSFLKRVYKKELPQDFLAQMPGKMRPLLGITQVFPTTEAREAVKVLVQFTDAIPSQDLADLEVSLAADYARLFLSTNDVPPHPSESVYLDGSMMLNSRDDVLKTYWSFGVDKKKEFTEPEDHIAVELSFMMHLCRRALEALKDGDTGEAARCIQGQKDFLEMHLLKWVPKLVNDIVNTGRTPFYKAMGVLTREYIVIDSSVASSQLEQLRGIGEE